MEGVSAREAKKILNDNFGNLKKKVETGKTLTAGERALLVAVSKPKAKPKTDSAWAKNYVELAAALDVARKTIQRRREDPNRPEPAPDGRHNIAAWRKFLGDVIPAEDDEDELPAQSTLKARQLLLQNRKLERTIAILDRQYVPIADVEKWGADLGSAISNVVTKLHLKAPDYEDLKTPEAEKLLKKAEDEILQQLSLLTNVIRRWHEATEIPADEPAP